MTVGVGPDLHGFAVDCVQEEAVLCHMLWLCYKTIILNSHRAGHAYHKHHLRVKSDMFSSCSLSKQEKKNMENWRYFGSQ